MRRHISALLLVSVSFAGFAKQPKEVTLVASEPVQVNISDEVVLAPGQQIESVDRVFLPEEVLILQAFLATSSAQTRSIVVPRNMVLQTISVVPASFDTDPNLFNCGATVRWPRDPSPIDPASTDRIIVRHLWKGTDQIALNYAMPYKLFLEAGSSLEAGVGRGGASGFCSALVILTGTTLP